jgi:hypothetical protein
VEAPSEAPYVPSSGNQLIEFVPSGLTGKPILGSQDSAQISVGDHISISCFRFNLYFIRLGCDSQPGEAFCEFRIWGYRFNVNSGKEDVAMSQTVWVPTCSGTSGCRLSAQSISGFENLSSIVITAKVNGEPRVFWADDIQYGWADNSCPAATCRQNAPVRRRDAPTAHWKWSRKGLHRVDSSRGENRLSAFIRAAFNV